MSDGTVRRYDDMFPVSVFQDKHGRLYLLDRHNDSIALFDKSRDLVECEKLAAAINNYDALRTQARELAEVVQRERISACPFTSWTMPAMEWLANDLDYQRAQAVLKEGA